MNDENLVLFKGTAEGIVVLLDKEAEFTTILQQFKEKIEYSKNFFKGSTVSMQFKGRALTTQQQDQLLSLLTHQNIINISFVHEFENENLAKQMIEIEHEALTHFHYGIVRSGHHIHYQGNVVVLGDINPGGLVTAGGHVIVLGSLKGKVHAGMNQSFKNPFVTAYFMAPIQIGIGHIIAQSANQHFFENSSNHVPQIAYLNEDQIYMDQIDAKTLQHMLK